MSESLRQLRSKPPAPPSAETPRLVMLPSESIFPNPYQPRRRFDQAGLDELTASIRASGLIQPLVVRKTSRGYELIAGERRLRACKALHMQRIPCIVRELTRDEDSALMALVENVQRRDLHFLEEAECYRAILRGCHMTQEALSARLGKSQSFLANKLRLLQLPPTVRRAMLDSGLTERHARALLKLHSEERQMQALLQIVEKQLNVKDAEHLIERMLAVPEPASARPALVRLLRDYRLFVNAVRTSADQLRSAGMQVELEQTDCEGGVDMLIRVRRPEAAGLCAKGGACGDQRGEQLPPSP